MTESKENQSNNKKKEEIDDDDFNIPLTKETTPQHVIIRIIDWTLMITIIALMLIYILIIKPQYNQQVIDACQTAIQTGVQYLN